MKILRKIAISLFVCFYMFICFALAAHSDAWMRTNGLVSPIGLPLWVTRVFLILCGVGMYFMFAFSKEKD